MAESQNGEKFSWEVRGLRRGVAIDSALGLVLFGAFWGFHDSKADHLVAVDRVILVGFICTRLDGEPMGWKEFDKKMKEPCHYGNGKLYWDCCYEPGGGSSTMIGG